jgi:YVTN family beta-propeller protein
MKRVILLVMLLFFVSGCETTPTLLKPVLVEEGEVYLYLQPVPQGGERLRFTLDSISALRDDGIDVPLSLHLDELRGQKHTGIQRLLASGILPPGLYSGISLSVKDAFLRGEEGEAALLVPEEPVTIGHAFQVRRGAAMVLLLVFDPAEAMSGGVRFVPAFSLSSPRQDLTNLMGYVTNADSNTVSVFNKQAMEIVGAISTGRRPEGIAIDRRRARAYVALPDDDGVEVIDAFTGERTSRIRLSLGDEPRELAVTQDGRTLVTANFGSNTASIIDPISLIEVGRVQVGSRPQSVVLDPLGLRAYVMNTLSNTVSVIDIAGRDLAATVAVDGMPVRGAFSRQGDRLYVVTRDSPHLAIIDASRLTVSGTIFVGVGAISIEVDRRTDLVLVGKRMGNEIVVVDPFASAVIDRIRIQGTPVFMTIDVEENSLLVLLPDRKALQRINLVSKRGTTELEVLDGAYAVGLIGER